jgi:hypothetical protein
MLKNEMESYVILGGMGLKNLTYTYIGVGGGVKNCQNHACIINEWSLFILKTVNVGMDRMNPGIRILNLPSANGFSKGGLAARGQSNFLYLRCETILEDVCTTSWQRHQDVKRKREYFHVIIFPEVTEILHEEGIECVNRRRNWE